VLGGTAGKALYRPSFRVGAARGGLLVQDVRVAARALAGAGPPAPLTGSVAG
jgi:hypothetical protein